jgi:hypothetical protein
MTLLRLAETPKIGVINLAVLPEDLLGVQLTDGDLAALEPLAAQVTGARY